jgi:hypothetical protein
MGEVGLEQAKALREKAKATPHVSHGLEETIRDATPDNSSNAG